MKLNFLISGEIKTFPGDVRSFSFCHVDIVFPNHDKCEGLLIRYVKDTPFFKKSKDKYTVTIKAICQVPLDWKEN